MYISAYSHDGYQGNNSKFPETEQNRELHCHPFEERHKISNNFAGQ